MNLYSKTLTLAILTLLAFNCKAQILRSTLSMAGSSHTLNLEGNHYYVSQSVGQSSVVGTFSHHGNIIRQGFQQPMGHHMVRIIRKKQLNVSIYPNPIRSKVYIRIIGQETNSYSITLSDQTGKIILQLDNSLEESYFLDLSTHAAGVYILEISDGNKYLKSSILKR